MAELSNWWSPGECDQMITKKVRRAMWLISRGKKISPQALLELFRSIDHLVNKDKYFLEAHRAAILADIPLPKRSTR